MGRSMSPRVVHEHARHIRATLGHLVEDVPEATSDVIDWILRAQRDRLEPLSELEEALELAQMDFGPPPLVASSNSSPSDHRPALPTHHLVTNGEAQAAEVRSPNGTSSSPVTELLVSPSPSPSPRVAKPPSTPLMRSCHSSPTSSAHLAVSPGAMSVNSGVTPCGSASAYLAASPGAMSVNSGVTPCGSARKLADNNVRTLTP